MSEVGLRYERLLLLTAPISAAAFFVLAVTLASSSQEELVRASCYDSEANAINANLPLLSGAWDRYTKTKDPLALIDYHSAIVKLNIPSPSPECFQRVLSESDKRGSVAPSAVAAQLKADAVALRKTPMRLLGAEMPEDATFEFFGVKLNAQLSGVSAILQILLTPVILLWLASLYNTRVQEIYKILPATSISGIFPHAVNVYPVAQSRRPRKRSWLNRLAPDFLGFRYFLYRTFNLLLFLGPPVAAYLVSLGYSSVWEAPWYYLVAGSVVGIYSFLNVIGESLLHSKVFPPPDHFNVERR
jgi:hypothetical protein